jgi:hypothetical protein
MLLPGQAIVLIDTQPLAYTDRPRSEEEPGQIPLQIVVGHVGVVST